MTIQEFKELHKNCELTIGMLNFGTADSPKYDIFCEACNDAFAEAPIPSKFCHDFINCAGNGYCNKDIACNE